ncbi:MAG: AAA family ATPase [Mesorhizobium sp.]|nr:AAA family ATPase [Mesorhizobium sp.]MBL8576137.1 AAA family ATPase [Mesorhizobium sp.]
MSKLSTFKGRFASSSPRKSVLASSSRTSDAKRAESSPWRSWYKSTRWEQIRQRVFVAAQFRCAQTGVLLLGTSPAWDSPVCDHIKPHRGNPALFWDEENLQCVSKAWHDSRKKAMENADKRAALHPEWLKPSQVPLTIVVGPPASGKSTYVRNHKVAGDLVLDVDVLASQISGEDLHTWNREAWLNAALSMRNDLLGEIGRTASYHGAWLILTEPKADKRQWWQDKMHPEEIIILETPEPICIANAEADGRNTKHTRDAIVSWWWTYERRRDETVLKWDVPSLRGGRVDPETALKGTAAGSSRIDFIPRGRNFGVS